MLEVAGLRKNFAGIAAVQDVSFDVERGEIVSLIGPNGAGKTTCFNLISGFLRPDLGRVTFEKQDVTGRSPHRIARLGVVRSFQKTNILKNLTVFENVLTARHVHGETSLIKTLFPTRAV